MQHTVNDKFIKVNEYSKVTESKGFMGVVSTKYIFLGVCTINTKYIKRYCTYSSAPEGTVDKDGVNTKLDLDGSLIVCKETVKEIDDLIKKANNATHSK